MPAAAATRPKTATRAASNARALERARNSQRAATRTAPVAPRRKSGPAARPRPVRKPVAAPAPRVARIAQGSAAILLDRLLRGRAWVVLVGALLAGIVFLNVSVLELNRGIAQTDAQSAGLERTNSTLRESVATLSSAERIQRLAEQRGYVLPQPGDVTYLHAGGPSQARLAAQRITAPGQSAAGTPQSAVSATPTATVTPAPASTQTQTQISPAPPTAAQPTVSATTTAP
jgi:cell division protein FtsB